MSGVKERVSQSGVVDFELVHAVHIRELELGHVLVTFSHLLQRRPHERVDSDEFQHDVIGVCVRGEFSVWLQLLDLNAVFL